MEGTIFLKVSKSSPVTKVIKILTIHLISYFVRHLKWFVKILMTFVTEPGDIRKRPGVFRGIEMEHWREIGQS